MLLSEVSFRVRLRPVRSDRPPVPNLVYNLGFHRSTSIKDNVVDGANTRPNWLSRVERGRGCTDGTVNAIQTKDRIVVVFFYSD